MSELIPWALAGISIGCAIVTWALSRKSAQWLKEAREHHAEASRLYDEATRIFADSGHQYERATAIMRKLNSESGEEATRH